jgi:hypothetical protein
MVMIFHQKCLDYFIENTASLQSQALERVFLTNSSVMDVRIRQFCMLWGIHLVDKEWPPLSQCKLWLDAIETSFQKTGGTHPDLRSIGDDIAVIEDNCHTDLNQILKRKDEITFEISPNVDVRVEDLVERERQLIDKTKKLMRSSRGHNG